MSDRRPSDPQLAGAAATPIVLADPARAPLNVLVVGVGGQGVIMVSKLIALLAQQRGYDVKQSEVHGMAKRGGAVFSHVRFGRQVWSPTIPKGEVDILIALEWAEGLRWLTHLKPETGIFICDTKRIVPPFACRDRRPGAAMRYVHETQADVIAHVAEGYAIDATRMAEELGNERAANILLLGALSAALHFPVADWEQVVTQFVPKKTVAVNIEAFRRGRRWIEQARAGLLRLRHQPRVRLKLAVVAEGDIDLRARPDDQQQASRTVQCDLLGQPDFVVDAGRLEGRAAAFGEPHQNPAD